MAAALNGATRIRTNPVGAMMTPDQGESMRLHGYFDGIRGRTVDGWIYDAASPDGVLTVEIFDGARRLGTTTASLFRSDLDAFGIGDGGHGFRFDLPDDLFDGRAHEISVRLPNSQLTVPGSPRRLHTATLEMTGSLAGPGAAAPTGSNGGGLVDQSVVKLLNAISDALTAQAHILRELLDRSAPVSAPPVVEAPAPVIVEPAPLPPNPFLAAIHGCPPHQHDIILFGIIDWHFRIQRPQHFAAGLAALGYRVVYVGVGFDDLHAQPQRFSVVGAPADRVWEIRLACRAPAPAVYSGFDDPAQMADLGAAARAMVDGLGLRSPVCVLQLPSWYPIANAVPGASIVFDCLDHLAGFTGVAPRVIELEHELIREADQVVVSSSFLAEAVAAEREPEIVRNAVDVAYFSRAPEVVHRLADGPVIGYYGAMADWFDLESSSIAPGATRSGGSF